MRQHVNPVNTRYVEKLGRGETRAMVLTTIQEVLDELPRACTKGLYEQKCNTVYQRFYEAYMGKGKSVYAGN